MNGEIEKKWNDFKARHPHANEREARDAFYAGALVVVQLVGVPEVTAGVVAECADYFDRFGQPHHGHEEEVTT